VQSELLRQSIRNSQKMRALKEVTDRSSDAAKSVTGNWNPAFSDDAGAESPKPTLSDVVDVVHRLTRDAGFMRLASSDSGASHALKTVAALTKDPAFQKSFVFVQKVRRLDIAFCVIIVFIVYLGSKVFFLFFYEKGASFLAEIFKKKRLFYRKLVKVQKMEPNIDLVIVSNSGLFKYCRRDEGFGACR
jgi:hypothetical protein